MHTPRSHLITLIGVLAFAFGSAAIADDVHPSSSSSKDAREAKVNQVALQRNETADNWRAMRASKLMGNYNEFRKEQSKFAAFHLFTA